MINKSSNFLPHREQMQILLRIYSNYESKSSFFLIIYQIYFSVFHSNLPCHLLTTGVTWTIWIPRSLGDSLHLRCHYLSLHANEKPWATLPPFSPSSPHQDSSSSLVSSTFMVSLKSFDPAHSQSHGEGSSPPHSPLRYFQQRLSAYMAPRLPLPAATHSPCWCYQFKNMNLTLLILCLKPYRSSLLHEQD